MFPFPPPSLPPTTTQSNMQPPAQTSAAAQINLPFPYMGSPMMPIAGSGNMPFPYPSRQAFGGHGYPANNLTAGQMPYPYSTGQSLAGPTGHRYPALNNTNPAPNNTTPAPNDTTPAPNDTTPAPNNTSAGQMPYPYSTGQCLAGPSGQGYPASNNMTPAPNNMTPAPNNNTPAPNNMTAGQMPYPYSTGQCFAGPSGQGYPASNNMTPAPNNNTPAPNNMTAGQMPYQYSTGQCFAGPPGQGYPASNNMTPAPNYNTPAPNNMTAGQMPYPYSTGQSFAGQGVPFPNNAGQSNMAFPAAGQCFPYVSQMPPWWPGAPVFNIYNGGPDKATCSGFVNKTNQPVVNEANAKSDPTTEREGQARSHAASKHDNEKETPKADATYSQLDDLGDFMKQPRSSCFVTEVSDEYPDDPPPRKVLALPWEEKVNDYNSSDELSEDFEPRRKRKTKSCRGGKADDRAVPGGSGLRRTNLNRGGAASGRGGTAAAGRGVRRRRAAPTYYEDGSEVILISSESDSEGRVETNMISQNKQGDSAQEPEECAPKEEKVLELEEPVLEDLQDPMFEDPQVTLFEDPQDPVFEDPQDPVVEEPQEPVVDEAMGVIEPGDIDFDLPFLVEGDEVEECSICFEEMLFSHRGLVMPCLCHKACVGCTVEWVLQHRTCYRCRSAVLTVRAV